MIYNIKKIYIFAIKILKSVRAKKVIGFPTMMMKHDIDSSSSVIFWYKKSVH